MPFGAPNLTQIYFDGIGLLPLATRRRAQRLLAR
jgi:hypothetical protein